MGETCNKMLKFGKSTLRNLATGVFSILLFFSIFPLLLSLLPFFFYRQVVIILAKVFKKDTLGKILSTRSAAMGNEKMYENPTLTLVSGVIVEGPADLEHFKRTVGGIFTEKNEAGELKYPELTMNISFWMGYPFWRKLKKFNLDGQIIYYKNDANHKTNQEQAKEIVIGLNFAPFSKDKPLWKIIILPNYTPDPAPNITPKDIQEKKYSMIIFIIHHGVADGFSQFGLMEKLSLKSKLELMKTFDYTHKEGMRQRNLCYRIFRNTSTALKMPFDLGKLVLENLLSLSRYSWIDNETDARDFKKSKSRGIKSPKESIRRFHGEFTAPFLLSEINDLKIKHGVSGTAILYSGIVGAARKLFKDGKMPKGISFGFPLPLPGRRDKLRNDVTGVGVFLPLREEDGIKRLNTIDKRLGQLKQSTLPILVAGGFSIAGGMPRWFAKFGLEKILRRLKIIAVSNVAGPKGQIDLCGYPVKDILFMTGVTVLSSMFGVAIISQGGQIRLGCGADEKLLKNEEAAKEFVQNFMNELYILRNCRERVHFINGIV